MVIFLDGRTQEVDVAFSKNNNSLIWTLKREIGISKRRMVVTCAWIASLGWSTSYAKYKLQVAKPLACFASKRHSFYVLQFTPSRSRFFSSKRFLMNIDGAARRSPEDVIRTLPPRLHESERRKLWEQIHELRQEKDLAAKEYRFEEAAKLKERALELMLQDPYACLELELQKAIEEERYRDAAIYTDAMKDIGEPPKKEKQDIQKGAPKSKSVFGFVPRDWPSKSNTGASNLRRTGIRDMTENSSYEVSNKNSDSSDGERSDEESRVGELNRSEYLRLEGFDSNVWEDGHSSSTLKEDHSGVDEVCDSKQKLFTYRELMQIQNKSDTVTMGIRVRVESCFSPVDSVVEEGIYTFVYHVEISNLSDYTVQLISREWDIQEVTGVCKKVTGTGVVGQQPILEPGETFQYSSKCPVRVPSFFNPSNDNFLGSMQGKYIFLRGEVGEEAFEVKIARFGFYLNVS